MARNISSIIAVLFTAVVLSGCGAGMPNAADPSSQEAKLAKLEAENEELRTKLEESKAEGQKEEAVSEQVAGKIQKRGLLDGNESESDAEPSRQQRGNPFGQLASFRGAVNRGVCRGNGIGPGVGHVFANMEAAKAAMNCNGFCFFLTNTSKSNMSVRVNHRAVTLCNGTEIFAPATIRSVPGILGDAPMSVSMAPPHSVVVLGKFLGKVYRSTSFQVELHDQLAPGGMFITHSEQEFSKVFPSGSPNGYSQLISPKRAR